MDRDRIEKSFDDDDLSLLRGDRSMEIEEDERFPEAGRKSIFGISPVDGSASVRDQLPGDVVNGDDDPPRSRPLPLYSPSPNALIVRGATPRDAK